MTIDRNNFTKPFTVDNPPCWNCPTCNGTLKLERPIDVISLKEYEVFDHEIIYGHGVFYGVIKCANAGCQKKVVISGDMIGGEGYEYDEAQEMAVDGAYVEYLIPTYFNPPLNLFEINKDVPPKIKTEIIKAFKLYWLDLDACANKIRRVVESIMNEKEGCKKEHLGQRIIRFRKNNPGYAGDLANLLDAKREIGNRGSHSGNILTQENLLDGFDMLRFVVNELYSKEKDEITEIGKKYIKPK